MWNHVVARNVDKMSEESNKRKGSRNNNEKCVKKYKKEHFSFGQSAGTKVIMSDHIRSFSCRIDGVPKPQSRALATTKGKGKVAMCDPSKMLKESSQNALVAALESSNARDLFTKGANPVVVKCRFYFPRPKAHYEYDDKMKELKIMTNAPVVVVNTPDIDNLDKFLLDAMKSVCYADDKCVVHLDSAKLYVSTQHIYRTGQHNEGYTLMKISEISSGTTEKGCECLCCLQKRKVG
jgi:Holliday junction resolvase RusA-like endonuclease